MVYKEPTIGDICEIKTPAGLAYVQLTHEGMNMGQLVRVLPGLFPTRPTDFVELGKKSELYFVFYPLSYATRDQKAEVVSHQPVPDWARPYPLMRWCGARDRNGNSTGWKIFSASSSLSIEDHQRTPVIRNLTPDQRKMSIHQLWPHPVLVKELARGWTPERAEELRLRDKAEARRQKIFSCAEGTHPKPMRHYLYFSKKPKAEEARDQLRGRGFTVVVRRSASGEEWLVLAAKTPPETGEQMDELRDEMESLARQFGGEYDGWEAAIDSLGSAERPE